MWIILKKIGWRIAGIYFWIRLLSWFSGFENEISGFEVSIFQHIATALSYIGASPANSKFLPLIVKGGWILFFTEFKPAQLMGFFLYLAFFPVAFLAFIANTFLGSGSVPVKENSNEEKDSSRKEEVSRTARNILPFPFLPSIVFLLFAWLLIFGNAVSTAVVAIGLTLTCLLSLVLFSRLFYSVKPTFDEAPAIFSWMDWPRKFIEDEGEMFKDVDTSKMDIEEQIEKKLSKANTFKGLAWWIRLKLGHKFVRNFFYLLVIFEFISSLVVTGACAILCWALLIKIVDPRNLDIFTCMQLSATYFLPGIDKPPVPDLVQIPTWIGIGAAITAWVLLALYVSLASNSIHKKQQVYINKLNLVRKNYKDLFVKIVNKEKNLYHLLEIYPQILKTTLKDFLKRKK